MATRRYYVTTTGQPPNGGVPPGTVFFGQPQTSDAPPPPPYSPPMMISPPPVTISLPTYVAMAIPPALPVYLAPVASSAPPPTPPAAPAPAPPAADPPAASFEIPGVTHDGENFVKNGLAYLFPESHTIVHFLHDGTRPFERPPGSTPEFAALKVPTMMTVADLMRRLGVPTGDDGRFGVTECIELGNGYWMKGTTYMLGEAKSQKTVKEIGWDGSRGTSSKPVWIAIHDKTRHGPT